MLKKHLINVVGMICIASAGVPALGLAQITLTSKLEKSLMHSVDSSFSSDGKIALLSGFSESNLFDASTGDLIKSIKTKSILRTSLISPDGSRVVTLDESGIVKLWDVETSVAIRELPHAKRVEGVSISPMGEFIATTTDVTIHIWELSTGDKVKTIRNEGYANSVSFSQDGQKLIVANRDSRAVVLDIQSGTVVNRLIQAGNRWVRHASFSLDGKLAVTASTDRTVKIWDLDSNTEIASYLHDGIVHSATFSPNGRFVLTVSDNPNNDNGLGIKGSAKVWDVQTGSMILEFPTDKVLSASFSPDGTYVILSSVTSSTEIFDIFSDRSILVSMCAVSRSSKIKEEKCPLKMLPADLMRKLKEMLFQ